jgi:hypothetical protein
MDTKQQAAPALDDLTREQLVQVGIVAESPLTPEELVLPLVDSADSGPAAPVPGRIRALRHALVELGVHEEPPGSNKNRFSAYFHKGAEPWCADFVSCMFDITGDRNRRLPWRNPSAVSSLVDWARQKHHVVNPAHLRSGDVFTIQNSRVSHCGIVWKVDQAAGIFVSVEGNTTRDAAHPGCIWVWSHRRRIQGGYVFVRIEPPW